MTNFNTIEKILQQLPVAYYLKRKLDVKLDYASTSYIDIFNNKLVVSYNQLADLSNPTEKDIRCLLYHEVSHAFLTPLKLNVSDAINIFEDERIETICKDYYLDVDFKEFVKRVNGYNGQLPTSGMQLFYQVVRYRVGPSQFVARVKELIKQYAKLNRDSSRNDCYNYQIDVLHFYNDVMNYWSSQNAAQQQNEEQNEEQKDEKQENAMQNGSQQSIGQENATENATVKQSTGSDDFQASMQEGLQEGLKNIQHDFDKMVDTNMQETFKQILFRKTSFAKANSSAINAYSGVFDYRSTIRQDCKYFVQKNRAGNVKRFSKIKLNLFIDNSGSFYYSEDIVNKLLYNLAMLERQTPDFRFDVVTMSYSEELLKKDERQISCSGCNYLDEKIIRLYEQLQDKSSSNINIVLFDGCAVSGYDSNRRQKYAKNLKAFNHQNCIIISDRSNKDHINEYCSAANKVIVTGNYANLLIQNVISNLQHGLR